MSKKEKEDLVLVGFGKYDLKDLIEFIDTPEEMILFMAPSEWPARYRRDTICDPEEIQAFRTYGMWVSNVLRK